MFYYELFNILETEYWYLMYSNVINYLVKYLSIFFFLIIAVKLMFEMLMF